MGVCFARIKCQLLPRAVCMDLWPATGMRPGVWTPHGLWCQMLELVGVPVLLLDPVGVWASSRWGGNGVCPQNQLPGGPVLGSFSCAT